MLIAYFTNPVKINLFCKTTIPSFSSSIFNILMLIIKIMPGKRKSRIFWYDYKADHIFEVPKKTYPGIVAHGWVSPALDEFGNELLWILNHPFKEDTREGKRALSAQRKIREWVDLLLQKPDPVSYSKKLSKALERFRLSIKATPCIVKKGGKSKEITFMSIRYRPDGESKYIPQFWLFCLAMTLNRFGMDSIGRCEICQNYFIDIKRRGKKYCSTLCTSLASTYRSLGKEVKEYEIPQITV